MSVRKKANLIRPLAAIAIAVFIGAWLWLLFPGDDMTPGRGDGLNDGVSLAYLRVLSRANAGDSEIRLRLATAEQRLDHWDEAEKTVAPLLAASGDIGRRARFLRLEVATRRMNAFPAGDQHRQKARLSAIAALESVLLHDGATFKLEDHASFARLTLSLGLPEQAARLYERLAVVDAASREAWLEQSATWYEAAGRREKAVALHLSLSETASSEKAAREHALKALELKRGGGASVARESVALANRLVARFPDDPALLEAARKTALAARDLRRARIWGRAQLSAAPTSRTALVDQIDVLLASGDVAGALPLLERLLARTPDDLSLRRKLALVATWANRPELALESWTHLARHGDEEARERALPLSRSLFNDQRVVELMEIKDRYGSLAVEDVLELADARERLGDPEAAAHVLDGGLTRFSNDQRLWKKKAELAERRGDLEEALAAHEQVKRRFGSTPESVETEIALLWRLGRMEQAVARARASESSMDTGDASFWRLFGDVAWVGGFRSDAGRAYRILWKTNARQATPIVADRLLILARDEKRHADLIAVGRGSFERFGDPEHLAEALELASTTRRHSDLSQLLALAAPHEPKFRSIAAYWLVKGYLARHDRRPNDAKAAFESALAANPRSSDARLELLWIAYETRNDEELLRRLDEWAKEEGHDPRFWEVFAASYARLGASAEAAEFRERRRQMLLGALPPASRNVPADRRIDHRGNLLPTQVRLAMAMDEGDRAAVRAVLTKDAQTLSLPERIDGERFLDRDESAWALLAKNKESEAPTKTNAVTDPETELQLREAFVDLREDRLSGLFGEASMASVGTVAVAEQKGWAMWRWDAIHGQIGIEAITRQLSLDGDFRPFASDRSERQAAALFERRSDFEQTTMALGALMLPGQARPSGRLKEVLRPGGGVELWIAGDWNGPPSNSGALRATALRRAAEAGVAVPLSNRDRASLAIGTHRLASHAGTWLAWGSSASAELAHETRLGNARMEMRIDGEAQSNDRAETLPADLFMAFPTVTTVDDVLARRYATAGVGLSLFDGSGRLGSGQGGAPRLRFLMDLWSGWLWPANHWLYSAEVGFGYTFAHWQEIVAKGYFFSARGGQPDERSYGLTLGYVLRWF